MSSMSCVTPEIGSISMRSTATTLPLAGHQPDPLRGDLAPAAGRGAQIDHGHAGPQQMIFVVDLGELEGGAAAIAPALRLLDIGIVELAL